MENQVIDVEAPAKVSRVTVTDLINWYKDSESASQRWRKNAEKWRNYKNGDQWTAEEIAEIEKRHQPVITTNMIAPKVNYLVGGEISGRVDPKALPVTNNEDGVAEAMTDALRFAAGRTQARVDQARTAVADEMFVEGISGAVLGVDLEDPRAPRLTCHHTPADRLFWDPHSSDTWLKDATYLGFASWMDLDAAREKYGERSDVVDSAVSAINESGDYHQDKPSSYWLDTKANRIKVLEVYWVEDGEWWFAHFVAGGGEPLAGPSLVPYRDDKGKTWCPLIMVRAYVDRENDAFGIVKDLVSPQDKLNKNESSATHAVHSNRVLHEEGTLLPDDITFAIENQKCDGLPKVQPGALSSRAVQVVSGMPLAQANVSLIQEAKADLDAIGPSAQQLVESSSSSGVSVARRKDIANIPLRPLFANLQEWTHDIYTGLWWLIRQFWTAEMWLRVTDDDEKKGYRFVGINRRTTFGERVSEFIGQGIPPPQALEMVGMPRWEAERMLQEVMNGAQQIVVGQAMRQYGIQSPEQAPPELRQAISQSIERLAIDALMRSPIMASPFIANNVAQIGVDIEISSTPDIGVVQQEQFEIIADMAGKGTFNPAVTPIPVMRMLIRASQLRDKDKLLEELDELSRPKEDPAAAQAQAMKMQMQLQTMQAELAKTIAEVEQIKANTAKTVAEIPGVDAATQLDAASAVSKSIEAGRSSVPNLDHGQPARGMPMQRSMEQ